MNRTTTLNEIDNRINELQMQYNSVVNKLTQMSSDHPAFSACVRDKNKISTEIYLEKKKRANVKSEKPAIGYDYGVQSIPKSSK